MGKISTEPLPSADLLVKILVLTERLHRDKSHSGSIPVPTVGPRGDHVLVVSPKGRFDRRRAHALVCDSRRTNATAELTGVVPAEPPAWSEFLAPMPPPVVQPVLDAAYPALVSGSSSLAARRYRTRDLGAPRSMNAMLARSAPRSLGKYQARPAVAAGAGV
ncbi:MAG: hypothetical protein ACR2JX_05800 [Mycobacteriales bacterium]